MDIPDDGVVPPLKERLAVVRADLEANAQRLGKVHTHLAPATDGSLNRREAPAPSDDSPYARLEGLLATLPVVEQAKGIIVARASCSPDEAFELLPSASGRAGIPVEMLAADIVDNIVRQRSPRPVPRPPRGRGGGERRTRQGLLA